MAAMKRLAETLLEEYGLRSKDFPILVETKTKITRIYKLPEELPKDIDFKVVKLNYHGV